MIPLPPRPMQDWVGARSEENFIAWGGYFFRRLTLYGMTPRSRVLEIGCGPGGLARWIVPWLDGGRYLAFDVNPEAIAWCRENLPGGEFHLAPVRNGAYAPLANERAADYRFPADDGSVDFVFAGSVFTHLFRDDAAQYLREIARVLAPEGIAIITVLLAPDGSGDSIQGPGVRLPKQPTGEYACSEWLVSHPWTMLWRMAQDAGLAAQRDEMGTWRSVVESGGNPDLWIQDVVSLRRA